MLSAVAQLGGRYAEAAWRTLMKPKTTTMPSYHRRPRRDSLPLSPESLGVPCGSAQYYRRVSAALILLKEARVEVIEIDRG